jgi:hypothetical protein
MAIHAPLILSLLSLATFVVGDSLASAQTTCSEIKTALGGKVFLEKDKEYTKENKDCK